MGLKTRLDGRSESNNSFVIKGPDEQVLAEIKLEDSSGVTLNISTCPGLYIQKPSGWSSKTNNEE